MVNVTRAIWEAAITATKQGLDNLFLIIDCNGYQNDGAINIAMSYKNLIKKWKGFGRCFKCRWSI